MSHIRTNSHHRAPQRRTSIMIASLAIITACLCSPYTESYGQEAQTVAFRKSNQISKRNIGSAKQLNGIVHIHHVFVSDPLSSWSDFEKNRARRKLREAYDFITLHARRHGQKLTFTDEFSETMLESRVPIDVDAHPHWTSVAIHSATNKSATQLVKTIKEEYQPDNVAICLHVNKPALSYNLAYYERVATRFAAERMVCFTAYPDGRETTSATYAHEVLHLFGAGDLYFPYDIEEDRKLQAQQLFPDDVMFRVDYDINALNIGPFTAYRVGWVNRLDERYKKFEDE